MYRTVPAERFLVCDWCKKETEVNSLDRMPDGWFQVTQGSSTSPSSAYKHFCTEKCLVDYTTA